jgi:predicted O-methyltransferase YrrM
MSYRPALEFLFPERPFFGGSTFGAQTHVVHHLTMTALVAMVAAAERPIRVLEVGSWLGFSALTWCHAVDRLSPKGGAVLCVDSWDPYFHDIDMTTGSGAYGNMNAMSKLGLSYDLFLHNMTFRAKGVEWSHMRGKSADVLPYLKPEQFDIVYLDGSHYYEDVKRDLQNTIGLVRDGGFLCGDDLNVQLHELDEATVRDKLQEDCYVDPATNAFYHPGVTLAVGERFGPVFEVAGFWGMRRAGAQFERFMPEKLPITIPDHFDADQRRDAGRLLGIPS